MKKIVVILLSIFLLTGCTFIDLKDDKVENIINTVIQKDINLYNNIFEGYKFYVPRGLKIADKNKYNQAHRFLMDMLLLAVDSMT